MFFLDDIVDKCDEEFGITDDSSSEEDDEISIPEGAVRYKQIFVNKLFEHINFSSVSLSVFLTQPV